MLSGIIIHCSGNFDMCVYRVLVFLFGVWFLFLAESVCSCILWRGARSSSFQGFLLSLLFLFIPVCPICILLFGCEKGSGLRRCRRLSDSRVLGGDSLSSLMCSRGCSGSDGGFSVWKQGEYFSVSHMVGVPVDWILVQCFLLCFCEVFNSFQCSTFLLVLASISGGTFDFPFFLGSGLGVF